MHPGIRSAPWTMVAAFAAILAVSPLVGAVDRTPYVVSELTSWNASLSAADRTEKYAAMDDTPFTFYRGTDHLYWKDKGTSASLSTYGNVAATRIWLQGDLHVNNMGAFDNDAGNVVYDLNDFDEAVLGDYQLDLWRCAVSLVLVMRDNGGFSATDENTVVDAFTENYLDTVASWNGNSGELTKTFTAANTYGQLDDFLADTAVSNTRTKMLDKYTSTSGGVRFLDPAKSSDLQAADAATVSAITAAMPAYGTTLSGGLSYSSSYFRVKSVAKRVHAGIGSLGTPRYYVLIEGASNGQNDDRILDVKLQGTPSPYLNLAASAKTATDNACGNNHARRAVIAYKALGNHVDDHLGWISFSGGIYSVRERSPFKGTLDTTLLNSIDRMTKMAEQWGQVLATAHCRADKDANATNVPYNIDGEITNRVSGHHSEFRALVRSIAIPYADQVEDDYWSFIFNLAPGG